MKVKKGQIIFLVVIFLIIVSKINCVFADSVTCIDVSKDDYEFNADLRYGGFPFEKVAGLLTDESFPQVYDFIVNGVDTDKIKKCKQEDVYKNLIDSTLEKMDQIQKADTAGPAGGGGGYSIIDYFNSQGTSLEKEKEKLNNILNEIGASSQDKDKNAARYDDVNNLDEASKSTDIQTRVNAVTEATKAEEERQTTIYQQPTVATDKSSGSTLEDMMTDADNFVKSGDNDKVKSSDLQNLSGIIYNIALQIGIGVAVIAGLALGIQFMLSSVEGKADVKKGLKVYAIGCVVVFGSFGIWKLVVTLMQQI